MMPKQKKKSRKAAKKREKGMTTPGILQSIYNYRKYISWTIVAVIALLAFYVRIIPAQKHGIELHANDPWIMYWATDYLVHHGILSWFTLTPSNPATHIFWYPWGRDFVHSEYPLTMFITALSYPLGHAMGLTVKEWSALMPPVFGTLAVIFAYLLARELGGELSGIIASFLIAFLPGTFERTVVGFIEKEGIAMPFYLLGFYFMARMIKRYSIIDALLSGIFIGLVAWTWGGYQAIFVLTGAIIAIIPIFKKTVKKDIVTQGVLVATITAISASSPVVGFRDTFMGAGLIVIGGYILLLYSWMLEKEVGKIDFLAKLGVRKTYFGSLILAAIIGALIIVQGDLRVSARALYFLGKHSSSPLVASVAEHQAPSVTYLFSEQGLAVILTFIYLFWGTLQSRKDARHVVVLMPALLMLYASLKASYLIQTTSTILSISAALALAPVSKYLTKSYGLMTSKRRVRAPVDTLGASLWTTAVIVVVLLGLLHAHTTVVEAESLVPSIKAGGLGLPIENDAWIKALNILSNDTPKDSVVIAWWDYGYWISVGAHRATVADGATINSTQISLLAKALTATSENETLNILYNDFRTKPNKTYIVIFDVFRSYNTKAGNVWLTGPYVSLASGTEGMGDIPKSVWMLRIGGRMGLHEIQPYFRPVKIPVGGERYAYIMAPAWNTSLVQKTMIYRLFVDGVYHLSETMTPGCTNLTGTHIFVDWASFGGKSITSIADNPLKHIKPFKTAVGCIFDGQTEKLYVAVFIFKVQ
jgi:dolichyl-diphosphooligosaccharide--protein glycosyltransferase